MKTAFRDWDVTTAGSPTKFKEHSIRWTKNMNNKENITNFLRNNWVHVFFLFHSYFLVELVYI